MKTPVFTHEDGLKVIHEMIERTKTRYEKGAGTPMIYWGSLTMATIVLFLILKALKMPFADWVWFLFLPGAVISYIKERKRQKNRPIVKTQIDMFAKSIGRSMIASFLLLHSIILLLVFTLKVESLLLLFLPGLLIICGMGLYLTGKILRQTEFSLAGIVFWTGALSSALAYALRQEIEWQLGVVALVMIAGLIIPGIRLNKKARSHA